MHVIAICVHKKVNLISTSLCFKRTLCLEGVERKEVDFGVTEVVAG